MKGISKGYEHISVDVIDYNMHLAEHSWNCYKMTWHELQSKQYNNRQAYVIKAIDDIIKFRALPMPREQAIITFRINNISRVCLAQLTRQRKAAFNVESQMPRPIHHDVIIPLNIVLDDELSLEADELVRKSQAFYDKCIAKGIPPQDARYLTMHGQTTSCVYVVDINTFIGSFGMRCENNLTDELNLVYRLCKKAILDRVRKDFKMRKIDALTKRMYEEIIGPADCLGAKQKKGMNYDAVFGNSFDRYPDANEEVTEITKNCDYDFRKSAWYLELIKMSENRPELLFDGEKEMIDRWRKQQ